MTSYCRGKFQNKLLIFSKRTLMLHIGIATKRQFECINTMRLHRNDSVRRKISDSLERARFHVVQYDLLLGDSRTHQIGGNRKR